MFRRVPVLLCMLTCLALAVPSAACAQQDDIDFNRARALMQRRQQGEQLTPDEQAYLERARQQFQQRQQRQQQPGQMGAIITPPPGLKPLTDMTAGDRYKGEDGGLYGGGQNSPPPAHLNAALEHARAIQPLDAQGRPAAAGKIGFISVGMSNTTQEFSVFAPLANADPEKSSAVQIVDGAQGAREARAWAQFEQIAPPGAANPWDVLDDRLRQANLAPAQVQVAWIKLARANPASVGDFPKHTDEMRGYMVTILQKLKDRFPNLRIAYLSSRIYAGYARTNLNPEPYAYEEAFVMRDLIRQQVQQDPALNYDPARGKAASPLLLWGPYLWADGERGRKLDDLVWKPEDLGPDGTHPSRSGQQKVAALLLEFLKTEPTARIWFTGGR